MPKNKVAVLLSTYNGEKYIGQLLESLTLQINKDFDIYVRDDGSSDSTLSLIYSYKNQLNLIFVDSNTNLGPALSFMELLIYSPGHYEIYMFADQDDWWEKEKVNRVFLSACGRDSCVPYLYFSALELVDSELRKIGTTPSCYIPSKFNSMVENVASGCTIGINSAARKLIISSLPARYSMHDWWIYIVVSHFGDVYYDNRPSIKYRQHSSNAIGGTVGLLPDIIRRVRRFVLKSNTGVFLISDQANEFLSCFGGLLTGKDVSIIKRLATKNLCNRLWLAVFSPFFRQSYLDNLMLRFVFLIGKY